MYFTVKMISIDITIEGIERELSQRKPSEVYGQLYKALHPGLSSIQTDIIGSYASALATKLLEEEFFWLLGKRYEAEVGESLFEYLLRIPIEFGKSKFQSKKKEKGNKVVERRMNQVMQLHDIKEVDSPRYDEAKDAYLKLFEGEDTYNKVKGIADELVALGRFQRSFSLLLRGYFINLKISREWQKFHRDSYTPTAEEVSEFEVWLRDNKDLEVPFSFDELFRTRAIKIHERISTLNEIYKDRSDLGRSVNVSRELLSAYLADLFSTKPTD